MTTPAKGRLILDAPRSAPLNMALDETLLDGGCPGSDAPTRNGPAAGSWTSVLRRTSWEVPAATLGRFQTYTQFEIAGALRASVRRITGGGAILHHDELTIAIVATTPSPLFPDPSPLALAERIADSVVRALIARDPSLHRRGGTSDESSQTGVLDCFERRSSFDLVDRHGTKTAGLALHRRNGHVLVQGSIRRRPLGLRREDDEATLRAIAQAVGIEELVTTGFTSEEFARAEELVALRYGRDSWNQRRQQVREREGSSTEITAPPTTPRAH